MQFTLRATRRTPHGAPRLVQAMSAWLVKTRRTPSRHSRDARVYGYTLTAMQKRSTPPPPLLSLYMIKKHYFKHVSCEFDKFTVDTHLCKLRDTPAARFCRCINLECMTYDTTNVATVNINNEKLSIEFTVGALCASSQGNYLS